MAAPGLQVSEQELLTTGVDAELAALILERANELLAVGSPSGDRSAAEHCWSELSRSLLTAEVPFDTHRLLHERVFAGRDPADGPAPAWLPSVAEVHASNLYALMRARGCATYRELFDWSVANRMEFWRTMVERLGIRFARPCSAIADLDGSARPALVPGRPPQHRRELLRRAAGGAGDHPPGRGWRAVVHDRRRVAGSGRPGGERADCAAGYRAGDALAIYLPMTAEAVAIYLGIVFAGCTAVGIADSFAADEIRVRLRITGCEGDLHPGRDAARRQGAAAVRQGDRGGRAGGHRPRLRRGGRRRSAATATCGWEAFLSNETAFTPVACDPDAATNILFSSGTTGEPKAIPWTHTTPVKCAADGWLHQDIHAPATWRRGPPAWAG